MVEDGQSQTILERQHEHQQKAALAKIARKTWEEAAKKASKAGQRPPPMPPEATITVTELRMATKWERLMASAVS